MQHFMRRNLFIYPVQILSPFYGLISKLGHNLCNLGMTKSEIIFIIRPFTEIENFVIREKY